jgi:hypothetical protein
MTALALALALGLAGASSAAASPGYGGNHKSEPINPYHPVKRAPVIKSLVVTAAPTQAIAGQIITLRGRHFTRAMKLRLGAHAIAPRYVSSTQIQFKIPVTLAAKRYPMALVGPRRSKRLGTLAVYGPRPLPTVSFVITSAPSSAVAGQTITIRGHRFHRNMTLRLGGKTIAPRYASATTLQFVVPRSLAGSRYRMLLVSPLQTKAIGSLAVRRPRAPSYGWSFNVGMFFNLNG